MTFPVPPPTVDLEPWLASVGTVLTEIRGHDSGCTSYGVQVAGEHWFLKHAPDSERWQTDGAIGVHAVLRHPVVVPLVSDFTVAGGHVVVYPWVAGENLHDPQVPGALPREHPQSALNRFRALDDRRSLAAYDALLDAHLAVVEAGLVAVDLYDGCVLYDFERHAVGLVDLDLYCPPYRLELERQYGSSRLMPPEELTRGAWVDERATLFTLARLADHLGCVRTEEHRAAVARATHDDPGDRHATLAAYAEAWRAA